MARAARPRRKSASPKQGASASRAASTRDAIASAALRLFAERGFAAVSNKDLGRAAGVNPALIYYHFEDKQDLFAFVVRKALADAEAAYAAHRNGSRDGNRGSDLEAWLSSNVAISEELSRFLKIVFDYAQGDVRRAAIDRAIAAFYVREVAVLESALGRIPSRAARASELAELVSVFLDGLMVARIVRKGVRLERLARLMCVLLEGPAQATVPERSAPIRKIKPKRLG